MKIYYIIIKSILILTDQTHIYADANKDISKKLILKYCKVMILNIGSANMRLSYFEQTGKNQCAKKKINVSVILL